MLLRKFSHLKLVENDVKEICSVLFNATDINYFDYTKIKDDKKIISLTTNSEYKKTFFSEESHEKYYKNLKPGIRCNNDYIYSANLNAKKNFGIDNILQISIRTNDFYEIFSFGTEVGKNAVLNFYLHHLDCLLHFSYYFVTKAEKLIKQMEITSVSILSYHPYSPIINDYNFNINQFNNNVLIEKSKYYLERNMGIKLTKRQLEILYFSVRGKTAPEIAKILNLSYRTVNHYLENIKYKMGVSSKSELLEKVFDFFK